MQNRYRVLRKKVTHQGSPPPAPDDLLPPVSPETASDAVPLDETLCTYFLSDLARHGLKLVVSQPHEGLPAQQTLVAAPGISGRLI
jgi:hypothetical protein